MPKLSVLFSVISISRSILFFKCLKMGHNVFNLFQKLSKITDYIWIWCATISFIPLVNTEFLHTQKIISVFLSDSSQLKTRITHTKYLFNGESFLDVFNLKFSFLFVGFLFGTYKNWCEYKIHTPHTRSMTQFLFFSSFASICLLFCLLEMCPVFFALRFMLSIVFWWKKS